MRILRSMLDCIQQKIMKKTLPISELYCKNSTFLTQFLSITVFIPAFCTKTIENFSMRIPSAEGKRRVQRVVAVARVSANSSQFATTVSSEVVSAKCQTLPRLLSFVRNSFEERFPFQVTEQA